MKKCNINNTKSYVETFQVSSIDALPDHYELLVFSQLLSAKDPTALHVKYQTIVSTSALRDLQGVLTAVLDDVKEN